MRYLRTLGATLRALALAALASVAATDATAQAPADSDTAAWNRARQENTIEGYQRYLELYPLGAYSAEAFQALVELLQVFEGPEQPPDQALPGFDVY
jgi:hypothetical protein